jgi:lipid II:glycine glycyltransferase (peptidoglycan interpeptide bridge formation enzyme)
VVKQYQKILRQEIRTGRRRGLMTEVDEHWQRRDEFVRLYHSTMRRNHASAQYFFSPGYFDQLRSELAPHARLMVTRLDEQVAAAGVFVEYAGIVHAHLAGSSDELKGLSPLKTLLDDVRIWAQQRGNHSMHLGGGRSGKDDSLLAFKSRFSPRRHEFFVGRWILDSSAYQELCDQRRAYASRAHLVSEDEEFFPRYRSHLVPTPGASTPWTPNHT